MPGGAGGRVDLSHACRRGPLQRLVAARRALLLGLALLLCGSALLPPAASGQSVSAPVIKSVGPFSVPEGDTSVTTLVATDADTPAANLTWRTTGGPDEARFSLTATGELSFTAAKDFENPDDADADRSYLVRVEVSDGANTDSADLVVTLTDVAEPPSITSAGPFPVAEGDTSVTTLLAVDPDTTASDLTWTTTGGADGDSFSLSATGELSFTAAKDFENPDDADTDGSYLVTVEVSDGTNTESADLVVTLTNVTELAASITGPSSVSLAENSSARVATFSASSDADRAGVAWTMSGADAAHFTLDSATGALRFAIGPVSPQLFAAPPDYESPADDGTDNNYALTLQASAGTDTTSTFDVAVTVTDVDEPGAVSLSTTKPRAGTQLTATLSDPDGVTAGTASWKWERNDGREGWLEIAGATSASYAPVAADGDRYLRVTATYTDGFGAGKTAEAMAPNVVIVHRLSSLTVGGLTAVPGDDRVFYPAFDQDTLHYAARCSDSMTMTLSAESADMRVAVNGVQRPQGTAISLRGLPAESDIRIRLSGAAGGSTTYVVHCLDRDAFPQFTTVKATGATEDLLLFKYRVSRGRPPSWLVMMDSNGVPRLRHRVEDDVFAYFRVHPGESHPRARYSYQKRGDSLAQDGVEMVVLDRYFEVVADEIHVKSPFNNTDGHDQQITPSGNYVLMAYSRHQRDLRFLNEMLPDLPSPDGGLLKSNERVRDSAIQIQKPDGTVVFNWSSWDHMAIEDCQTRTEFREEYAHIAALAWYDGDIIAGFRHCSKILRIDVDSGDVVWRAGPSLHTREQWEAGETSQPDRGPAPLDFVNDPRGGFSGQHSGHMTAESTLLVYDNATHCGLPPGVPEGVKGLTQCSGDTIRTRAVEYALDTANHEMIFLRDFVMPETDPPRSTGGPGGHAHPMDNGDWLISWSNTQRSGNRAPMPHTAIQVDPRTGTEKLTMTMRNIGSDDNPINNSRTTMISPVALAPRNEALEAVFPDSHHTDVFHEGATDSPQVVIAFNRPIVDFDEASPSLSVTGGTVATVSAHVEPGEPAHAYLVTLTPEGAGDVTLALALNQACVDGGICTADGTLLTEAPAALVIGPPPSVSFERATLSALEGATLDVAVRLSAAHQGIRGVTVPIVLDTSGSASAGDLTAGESVTFAAGQGRQTLTLEAVRDDLVEGAETAALEFGTLPEGMTRGATPSSTVTVTDGDQARISFEAATSQLPEGAEVDLTFSITNGVTFEREEVITLTVGGTATPGDDFTLVGADSQSLPTLYTLAFPAGTASTSFQIRAVDDSDIEAVAETITVSATLDLTGASLGTRTVTIPPSDVPGAPLVTITQGTPVTEGADATFTLTRTPGVNLPLSEPFTVPVWVSATGSTLRGSPPASARFEAGSATTTLEVPTRDDLVVEPAGTVTALVPGSTAVPPLYLTGVPNVATVEVHDNDTAAFTLTASAQEVAEGNAVTLTIAADGVTFAEPQELSLVFGGTANYPDDFALTSGGRELSAPFTITLPASATSVAVTVNTLSDGEDDPGETIEIMASHDGLTVGAITLTVLAPPASPPVQPPSAVGGIAIPGGGGEGPTGPEPSEADFEWTVEHDIEALDSGHRAATGAWSDGEAAWVLDNPDGAGDAVYAYDLGSGERDPEREFALAETNRAPRGIWSDGETAWVSDSGRERLFAYDLDSGERDPERELGLAPRNDDARGIWSDGETMWVLDDRRNAVFAYGLQTGEPIAEYALDEANDQPQGLWSDGVALWVSNHDPKRLFAYRLPSPADDRGGEDLALERAPGEDFTEPGGVGNNSPRGIWAGAGLMYVVDANDRKVYSYNMPDAWDARLASLMLPGVDIGAFDPDRTDYEGAPAGGVTETTVEAAAEQEGATVAVEPADADGEAAGHQVALAGVGEITVTVTSADGSRERVYRVTLTESGPSADCLSGAVAVGFSLVVYGGGSVDALEACARSRHVTALYALHEGAWVSYIVGAPDVVNAAFGELFAEGVGANTPLTVRSEGPATEAPGAPVAAEPGSTCLEGELAEGFSLLFYEGGSVAELVACAEGLAVVALYVLSDGEWVSHILGAPGFVNAAFGDLFADAVPALTPLVARSE